MGVLVETRTELDPVAHGRAVKRAVVEAQRLALRAALVDGRPEVVLGVSEAVWALRRAGGGPGAWTATGGAGTGLGLEVVEGTEAVAVTFTGRSRAVTQAIGLMVRAQETGWR